MKLLVSLSIGFIETVGPYAIGLTETAGSISVRLKKTVGRKGRIGNRWRRRRQVTACLTFSDQFLGLYGFERLCCFKTVYKRLRL